MLDHFSSTGLTIDPKRAKLMRFAESMRDHRREYEDLYRELQANFLPQRGRFDDVRASGTDSRRGKKNNTAVLNGSPIYAARTLASGMQAGITSPARPWFRLLPVNKELRKRASVTSFTDTVQRELRQMFQSSGAYNALHTSYGDLGVFGTDAAIFEPNKDTGFKLTQLAPGTYWVMANGVGRIDTLYYEDWMTITQIVGKFVFNDNPKADPDWSKVSRQIKDLWDGSNTSLTRRVGRLIAPRFDRDELSKHAMNKAVASIWWEIECDGDDVLRNGGYDENPIIASRWAVEGNDSYGRSPGMDSLTDAKTLQLQERDKAEAVRRMNRPAVNAPTSMRNNPFSLLPGSVNFTDDPNGVRPVFETTPNVEQLRADIMATEQRISHGMYEDLFLMLAQSVNREITAREVEERHEEKLIALGPVLEMQHAEKLRPLILKAYKLAIASGRIPEAPPELDKEKLEIDYISMLAQAQRAVHTGAIERLYGFAGNLSAVKPGVLDKLDEDETIDQYADALGIAGGIVRDSTTVNEVRGARQQQEQAMATAEAAPKVATAAKAGADAAKVLADADATNSPGDVLRRIGAGI